MPTFNWQAYPGATSAAGLGVNANQDGRLTVGAELLAPLAIQTDVDGRIEVFGLERSSFDQAIRVWHIWQTAANGGCGDWRCLTGGPFDNGLVNVPVYVDKNADGHLEVSAARSMDNIIGHVWQISPGGLV